MTHRLSKIESDDDDDEDDSSSQDSKQNELNIRPSQNLNISNFVKFFIHLINQNISAKY